MFVRINMINKDINVCIFLDKTMFAGIMGISIHG